MTRHKNCNMFVDNFAFENLGKNCPTCSSLGEDHLCGSQPQRPQQVQPDSLSTYSHSNVGHIYYLQEVVIANAKHIHGIRKGVYECAASSFGFSADSNRVTIEYPEACDHLHCAVLFKNSQQIRMFRRDIQGLLCKASLVEEFDMKTMSEKIVLNERELLPIETFLYKSDDASLNDIFDAFSVASTATTVTAVSLASNPLIQLQMIENKQYGFISRVDLIRCHLISKSECENEEGLCPLNKDENNCLYMSGPMYQRFDGLHSGVPTFAIRFGEIIGQDVGTVGGCSYSRTKVSIVMEFRPGDKQTPSDIKEALQHHSYDPATNQFTFHVSVLDLNHA
eukprot:gene29158-38221_t